MQPRIDTSLGELLDKKFPHRQDILSPWLRMCDLVLLFAPRESGKTYLALTLAFSLSQGTGFLHWPNNTAYKVHYIDGEMGEYDLQERLTEMESAAPDFINRTNLRILTPEHCGGIMWNMAHISDQLRYQEIIKDSEIIVIDNLLSCSQPLNNRDDDVQQWRRIQTWLVKLRTEGKTIILLHHAGKSGLQLGTSMRENAVTTVINLRQSKLQDFKDRTAIEFRFEKSRKMLGEARSPLLIEYRTVNGALYWAFKKLADVEKEAVLREYKTLTQKQYIANKLELPLWRVTEILNEKPFEFKESDDDELW